MRYVALVLILMSTGCAARTHVVEGIYQRGFESEQFFACGRPADDSPWWVSLSERARTQWDSLSQGLRPVGLYAKVRGSLTERGQFGHLGLSTRILRVAEFVELRPRAESDCNPISNRSMMIKRE